MLGEQVRPGYRGQHPQGARARIIAVNPDGDAPIFGFAEAGAVADARQLLPLLAAVLERMEKEPA
ncbi:hypothetical protein [Novosphingobium sp.]|uniref:hypothetical protein n=1 Tax=Novosphingobium sp. TaxID=1874826 RepID=UPI002732E311|nr:hypothetical protein [Novosphingobium sp.]MDP3908646.1 hypothetical protein [Novosphingobium sp.]